MDKKDKFDVDFSVRINLIRADNAAMYKVITDVLKASYIADARFVPDILDDIPDLHEYLLEFIHEVKACCTINIHYDYKRGDSIAIYISRLDADGFTDCRGFMFELSFEDLKDYDIPHLGDAIFHMWNAYVDVSEGVHACEDIRPSRSVKVEDVPIPEGDSDAID